MRKLLSPGILAVFFLFLPLKSQAVPLDVPYQILVSTVNNTSTIVISTSNFSSLVPSINANVATAQWCIEHAVVSTPSAASFSMSWSTSTTGVSTTDYVAATVANTPYDTNFQYRDPYCAPVGNTVLTLKSSVAGSTITASGYLFRGWTQ